jgi:hypothetical protein
MEKRNAKRRPLSARRSVECREIDPAVRTFLSTPVCLTVVKDDTRLHIRRRAKPVAVLSPSENIENDPLMNAQRRAFELNHAKESMKREQDEERKWRKSETFRKWKNDRMKSSISVMQRDVLGTETVIGQRNEWYRATIKSQFFVPVGTNLRTVRGVPEGMKLSAAVRNSATYSW